MKDHATKPSKQRGRPSKRKSEKIVKRKSLDDTLPVEESATRASGPEGAVEAVGVHSCTTSQLSARGQLISRRSKESMMRCPSASESTTPILAA